MQPRGTPPHLSVCEQPAASKRSCWMGPTARSSTAGIQRRASHLAGLPRFCVVGRLDVGVEGRGGHGGGPGCRAASHPPPASLARVLPPHRQHRAHPREAVEHERGGAPDHRQHEPPVERPVPSAAAPPGRRSGRAPPRLLEPARLDVGAEGSRGPVVGQDVVALPALLVEPQPAPTPLPEIVRSRSSGQGARVDLSRDPAHPLPPPGRETSAARETGGGGLTGCPRALWEPPTRPIRRRLIGRQPDGIPGPRVGARPRPAVGFRSVGGARG